MLQTLLAALPVLIAVAVVLAVAAIAFYTITPLRRWLLDSETLGLGWLQIIAAPVLAAVQHFDPGILAPYLGDKPWFPAFLFAWGILTNLARRFRAEDL
ncbi:hypothetical protein [Microbaculum marinum]|uniref:Uncharacterized protein n=1 Tax=Microbaculum marinum TaxID=1764581 RepID=A0AAW9RUG9_9HYPH